MACRGTTREAFSDESGMTLAEMMIVIVLIGIVSGGLLALLIDSGRLFQVSQQLSEAQDNARIAMDRISKDIRQGERWEMTTGYEIRFRQYFDSERRVKSIGYRLTNRVGTAGDPGYDSIERYVDNDVFDASPGTYTPVADYVLNRRLSTPVPVFTYHLPGSVGIQLRVDVEPDRPPSPVTLNASIEPRNQSKQEW